MKWKIPVSFQLDELASAIKAFGHMPEPNVLKQLTGLQGEELICDRESLGSQKSYYFRL